VTCSLENAIFLLNYLASLLLRWPTFSCGPAILCARCNCAVPYRRYALRTMSSWAPSGNLFPRSQF